MSWASVEAAIEWYNPNGNPPVVWNLDPSSIDYSISSFNDSEKNAIIYELYYVYSHSPSAAQLLDDWVSGLNTIKIGKANVGQIGFRFKAEPEISVPDYLAFDLVGQETFRYINTHGEIVYDYLGLTLIHEIFHLITDNGDLIPELPLEADFNTGNFDNYGKTLDFQNKVALELGITDKVQAGYMASVSRYD